MKRFLSFVLCATCFILSRADEATHPFSQEFVQVDSGVRLEVLRWRGSGPSLVLIPGMGCDAHIFERFAGELSKRAFDVLAITRRGFGASDRPEHGYTAEQLGKDVLAVIEHYQLVKPLLVGHSIGGSELSWISDLHPEAASGFVYLDAAYSYAYYSERSADTMRLGIDANEVRQKLSAILPGSGAKSPKQLLRELQADLISLQDSTARFYESVKDLPDPPESAVREDRVVHEIFLGLRKTTRLQGPILAIFSSRKEGKDPAGAGLMNQSDALEAEVPNARVVRLADADHFLFTSNEREVLNLVTTFAKRVSLPAGQDAKD